MRASPLLLLLAVASCGPPPAPADGGADFSTSDAKPAADLAASDAARPADLTALDLTAPDLATADLATPDLATPDLATPDLATPDLAAPDLATPDLVVRDFALPPDLAMAPGRRLDFAAVRTYAMLGRKPYAIAAGDLNGDKKPDLVTAGSGSVNVLLNDGAGRYLPATFYGLKMQFNDTSPGVAIADINLDGRNDVLVSGSDGISLMTNAGGGVLNAPVPVAMANTVTMLAAGDWNGDGKTDIAYVGSGALGVLLNNNGALAAPLTVNLMGARRLAAGDLNGDGKLDVVVGGDAAWTLFGKGDGTFQAPVQVSNSPTVAVALGDLTGDGRPELAYVQNNYFVHVLGNNGNGAFAGDTGPGMQGQVLTVAIGDLDGDGKADLLVPNRERAETAVHPGKGDGGFNAAAKYPTGHQADAVVLADVDNDGILDAAIAHGSGDNVSVLLGRKGPLVAAARLLNGRPGGMTAGDVNGDGRDDLVAAVSGGTGVWVYLGGANGLPAMPSSTVPTGNTAAAPALGDLDADGKLDLAVSIVGSSVEVRKGNGDGTFGAAQPYATAAGPSQVVITDIDGDGKRDVIVGESTNSSVSILRGNGNGTLQAKITYAMGVQAIAIAVADFNQDGRGDIAAVAPGAPNATLLLSTNGGYLAATPVPAANGPQSVTAGDLNGDGKPDLVVTGRFSNDAVVLIGLGNGTFLAGVSYPAVEEPRFAAIADLDGDGKVDIAVANQTSNDVSVLTGDGAGGFRPSVNFAVGDTPFWMATGDFNGDGWRDITTADLAQSTGGDVGILMNTSK